MKEEEEEVAEEVAEEDLAKEKLILSENWTQHSPVWFPDLPNSVNLVMEIEYDLRQACFRH